MNNLLQAARQVEQVIQKACRILGFISSDVESKDKGIMMNFRKH